MKRKIKFRAKTIDTDEWIYGGGVQRIGDQTLMLIDNGAGPGVRAVHPETVGQYIGRKDKHGKEVYEKDILFEEDDLDGKELEVYWDDELSGFRCRRGYYTRGTIPESENIEIIGNMNEHPELLTDE